MEWKKIDGYENYFINRYGVVKRTPINSPGTFTRITYYPKPFIGKNGYIRIAVSKNGKSKKFSIHRLLAINFIPNPKNKTTVNHKNGVRNDNRLCNLEWASCSENILHGFNSNGRVSPCRKLTDHQVRYIRKHSVGSTTGVPGGNFGDLAVKFSVHKDTIRNIFRGRLYLSVTP